ncbi:MAG: phospholipase [Chloroflexi bacterium]|nr:phospholipase [Chloroflexota bacterium]
MKAMPRTIAIYFLMAGLFAISLAISSCGSQSSINETSRKDFTITDFEAVHAPVNNDANEFLIFGNLPITPAAQGLSTELAAFLGRWEGYDYSPPVKKDYKIVLVIQDISAQGGKAFLWLGTNLQYPSSIQEINFMEVPGAAPAIEFDATFGNSTQTLRLVYDPNKKTLGSQDSTYRALELSRAKTFYVYKDYSQYLASKRISTKEYLNKDMQQYGQGYMLYLPEGYEANSTKTWPLLFFLHGAGDRGDNLNLLAKASPFMMIREKGPLPFLIVAPLLNAAQSEFPLEYLDGVLAEAQAIYRVDPKRIYVTGLSLGGEATYRFVIQHPETFAAIAPLSAWLAADQISLLKRIKSLPVWAIHGADDEIIPLTYGQQPADALKKLGGNIQFTVLAGHDHDTWTDTYSDSAFYDWLLQHQKP